MQILTVLLIVERCWSELIRSQTQVKSVMIPDDFIHGALRSPPHQGDRCGGMILCWACSLLLLFPSQRAGEQRGIESRV